MKPDVSPSQVFVEAGARILSSSGRVQVALNQALNQHVPWPFRAATASLRDMDGRESEVFATVISAGGLDSDSDRGAGAISADNAACVIDVNENLDAESLCAAYGRIASAKRLKKTAATDLPGVIMTTETLGIVLARETTLPMDQLAEELDRLNRTHPDREWTDMVVVLSQGIINYAVQFPGEGVTGDFLPPAPGALERYSPPIYVVIVVKPTGRFSFNKMCYFVLAHLAIFSPGAKIPRLPEILEGVPQNAIAITGYQYNLNGQLRPVPRENYNDRYMPPRPFLIEDPAGNLLCTLRFLPWQDGGVILLNGKPLMAPFLVFLGKDALERAGTVKRSEGEISYVLPIGEADFRRMLDGIQKRSNMKVRADPSSLVVQKWMDEGTRTPLIARLYVGIFSLRDAVFPNHSDRSVFDKAYGQVLEGIANLRSASRDINQLVGEHLGRVEKGEIAKTHGSAIHVSESIDDELRKETEIFVNSAVRALKGGMQAVAKELGNDIGFLFQKEQAFEAGVNALKASDPKLAAYILETRKWSERLMRCRNAMEHEGWALPKVIYSQVGGTILGKEPEIQGQKLTDFVSFVLDRLVCFVEDVTVHCLAMRMPDGIAVTEIAVSQRDAEIPLRFQLTLREGGMPNWMLSYHSDSFGNV